MNDEYLERLGRLVDSAENYLAYKQMIKTGLSLEITIDALFNGITELRNEIKGLYFDAGGDDVWILGDYNGE